MTSLVRGWLVGLGKKILNDFLMTSWVGWLVWNFLKRLTFISVIIQQFILQKRRLEKVWLGHIGVALRDDHCGLSC